MKTLTNEQILEEVDKRNLYQEILEKLDDDDITNEVNRRGLEDSFQESDDQDEDALAEEQDREYRENNYVISKDFDRFKLREHLVDIAGLQSHVSDKTLFAKLEELLEYC